jgi:signal transduction histidine kinase
VKRHTAPLIPLALGVALPALVLASGWLWASWRERDLLAEQLEERLTRAAAVARAAVDEGLEELRRQEDARPFYLYNHFYSPPDVLALADPIAVSPLAREDLDPRVRGHFQVDPGGQVRTPFDVEDQEPSERALAIRRVIEGEGFLELRGGARQSGEAQDRIARFDEAKKKYAAARSQFKAAQDNSEADPNAVLPALGEENPSNVGNYTVSLNSWSNQLYNDLKNVNQKKANVSSSMLGKRSAPRINRRNVPQQQMLEQQQAPPPQAMNTEIAEGRQQQRAAPRKPRPPKPPPPTIADGVPMGPEVTVDYSPMAFARFGEELVLTREVTHEGVTSIQGVLLDRGHLTSSWVPSVVVRHVAAEVPARLVNGDSAGCFVTAPVSNIIEGPNLCFSDEGARATLASFDKRLYTQTGALGLLLAVIVLAMMAVVRASRRAAELVEQRSDFISAVSHELRTPITTLRMNAEMLRDDMVSEPRRPRFLSNMVGESVRLSHLVENVLEIARLDQGRRPLKRVDVDLGPFLADLAAQQSSFCETRGFTLEVEAPDDLVLHVDRQALESILVNLIENAVKYAADAEEKTVRLEVEPGRERATLHVLDRGPGVDEKDKARVFERFVRADHGKKHVVGTGLGLALVRDLARAHGGDVELHDRAGGGADVRVLLPLRAAS